MRSQEVDTRVDHYSGELSEWSGILGASQAMRSVLEMIERVGSSDVPVLITGESGTGKELVARAVHCRSQRNHKPFIAINCGAIPDTLLESELFGHEKGSFTGAHIQRKGRIESADGGTLFLDEIGELASPLQAKLLRFLQLGEIERVGGRVPQRVDARVIAATNADLQKRMAEGRFRDDLFYRLCVVSIQLPPLRERLGDVALLAREFLRRYAVENQKTIRSFTKQALRVLEAYAWPGNVRELENRIRRAVIMTNGEHVTPDDLELDGRKGSPMLQSLRQARAAVERDLIKQALGYHQGNISRAAQSINLTRPTFYSLMKKHGIK